MNYIDNFYLITLFLFLYIKKYLIFTVNNNSILIISLNYEKSNIIINFFN